MAEHSGLDPLYHYSGVSLSRLNAIVLSEAEVRQMKQYKKGVSMMI